MKFTDRELTVAVDEVAQGLYAATQPPWKRGKAAEGWADLTPMAKYQHRSAVGETLLPVLLALPERPTVGAAPEFSDEEYAEAAAAGIRPLMEQRKPGSFELLKPKQRARLVTSAVAMARAGIAAMPIRQDPDAIVIPDHL